MITKQELNPHKYTLTAEQEVNQLILLASINKIQTTWGKPMTVTSGVRSQADQTKINPNAPKSKHLLGAAVDIADSDGKLYTWCKANDATLAEAGLYCEEGTKGWVHFQCIAFGSYKSGGTRWFKP